MELFIEYQNRELDVVCVKSVCRKLNYLVSWSVSDCVDGFPSDDIVFHSTVISKFYAGGISDEIDMLVANFLNDSIGKSYECQHVVSNEVGD